MRTGVSHRGGDVAPALGRWEEYPAACSHCPLFSRRDGVSPRGSYVSGTKTGDYWTCAWMLCDHEFKPNEDHWVAWAVSLFPFYGEKKT